MARSFGERREEMTSPLRPPHMSCVGASPLVENLVAIGLSVTMEPTVILTTSKAPVSCGGLGTGISNHRRYTDQQSQHDSNDYFDHLLSLVVQLQI
jgi:protein-disulfide isomerase-like protein with CxxC motif